MAQDIVKFGTWQSKQPDEMTQSFSTTDSSETTRTMAGVLSGSPLFVVEAFNVTFNKLTATQLKNLLQQVLRRPGHPSYQLHYFSAYYGAWRTAAFYVTETSVQIRTIKEGNESYKSISFQTTGINPIA